MLYRFKSKNMGDVIMLEANGRQVLEIIGKDTGSPGIILPGQMPAALQALEAAIALENSASVDIDEEEDNGKKSEGVSLHQRAKPFMDMLRWNSEAGQEVVWGV